jgi:hypothetical protein
MTGNLILLPAFAMVALTFAVLLRLMFTRIGYLRTQRIHPQRVANAAQMAALVPDTRAADNVRNLFELPVLFYLAVIVAFLTAQGGIVVMTLAWGYVILRCAHSFIHCTYNKVMHRFYAFLSSVIVLASLWVTLAAGLAW